MRFSSFAILILLWLFPLRTAIKIRGMVNQTPRRRPMTEADEARTDPGLQQFMDASAAQLATLGFPVPRRVVAADQPLAYIVEAMTEHDGDLAVVMAAQLNATRRTMGAIAFHGGLADGRVIATSGFDSVSGVPRNPVYVREVFAGAVDVAELYAIHKFRMWEHAEQSGVVRLTRGQSMSEMIAYADREVDLSNDYLVERGIYERVGQNFRFTWTGALQCVFRGRFPWRQIISRREASTRDAILARYRAARAAGWSVEHGARPA